MTTSLRSEFEALFRGLQSGIPRLGYITDSSGSVVSAVLVVTELGQDSCVMGSTTIAELQLPLSPAISE